MRWQPRRHVPLIVALSLLLALVALVLPWWSVQSAASGFSTESQVAPFAPGDTDAVDETAVVAVGVLALVGIVGLVGGLALRLRGDEQGGLEPAGWLWLGGGGFLLVAALTAVITWPTGDHSFWGSTQAGPASVETAATWGWYLSLLAGSVASVSGLAWLLGAEHLRREGEGTEDEPPRQVDG